MATTPDPRESLDKAVERLQELTEEAVRLAAAIRRRTRYHGVTVGSALLEYLESQDVPRTASVIAEELWEGGVTTDSEFAGFTATVKNTLQQLSNRDQIHWSSHELGSGYVLGLRATRRTGRA